MFSYMITVPFICIFITSIQKIYIYSKKDKFIFSDYLQWIFCLIFAEIFILMRFFKGWVLNYVYICLLLNIFVIFIIIRMFKSLIVMKKNDKIKDFLDFKLIDDKSFSSIIIGIPIIISYVIAFIIGLF